MLVDLDVVLVDVVVVATASLILRARLGLDIALLNVDVVEELEALTFLKT